MAFLQWVLGKMGLNLNGEKTRVVDTKQGMFHFLGFEIGRWRSPNTGNRYAHVQPSAKSLQTIKSRVTTMTARRRSLIPLEQIIREVNETVMGWVNYFHFRNSSIRLLQVRTHLEERMRIHLQKRHKIRDRKSGYKRFSRRDLYGRYGLYKVPVTAGWKRAHALR